MGKNVKMFKILFVVLIVFSLSLTIGSGCKADTVDTGDIEETADEGVATEESETEKASTTENDSEAGDEVVEINFVSSLSAGESNVWFEAVVKRFNDSHPNIKIVPDYTSWPDLGTKVQAYITAGTAPDISLFAGDDWGGINFAKMGILEPLDEYLDPIKDQFKDFLFDEPGQCVYNGVWFGAPWLLVNQGLLFRVDYAKEAGVDPSSIETFDDLLAAVKKLHNPPDVYGFSWPLGPTWATWNAATLFLQNGVEGSGDFRPESKDALIEVLTVMDKLFEYCPPAAVNWEPADQTTAFEQGIIAANLNGTFFPATYAEQWYDINTVQMYPVPHGVHGDSPGVQGQVVGFTIYKDAAHKEEAGEVLRFFLQPENASSYPGNLSVFKESFWTTEDRVEATNELFDSNRGDSLAWWYEMTETNLDTSVRFPFLVTPKIEINKVWLDVEQKMFSDDSYTPEQAYEDLKSGVEAVIDK